MKIELQQSIDKTAQDATALKELKKKLNRTEGNVEEIKASAEEFRKKSEFQAEKLEAQTKQVSELERKLAVALEDIAELNG